MIDFKGNRDDHQNHMKFLKIIVTTLASKWLLRKIFMGEYANLLLDGLKLVKQG